MFVFKCLAGEAPKYLSNLLVRKTNLRQGLRSQNLDNVLSVPELSRKTFARRSFAYEGPKLWNKLPNSMRVCDKIDKFKKDLKTLLFVNTDF
jgi:hypothetical protein